MPRKSAKPAKTQRDFNHTWFLREWMEDAQLTQADLQKSLGWSKAKAHSVWHGQQYTQDIIDEVSDWLHVRPYELLMHPSLARAFRQLREEAARIVSDMDEAESKAAKRTGHAA